MRALALVALFPLAALGATTPTAPTVPQIIVTNGRLLNQNDQPLTGLQSLTFSLYPDLAKSGATETPVWTEKYQAQLDTTGIYRVELGGPVDDAGATTKPFDPTTFAAGADRFLEIAVNGETLSPRMHFGSMPFALIAGSAGDSALLGGQPPSAYQVAVTAAAPLALDAAGALSLPTASATAAGALSSADWTAFNAKQDALPTATAAVSGVLSSADWTTFNGKQNALPTATSAVSGVLSSADWTTFNGKQNALPTATGAVSGVLSAADWTLFNGKQNVLPTATSAVSGVLSAADWTTFNGKAAKTGEAGYIQNNASGTAQAASLNINGAATVGSVTSLGSIAAEVSLGVGPLAMTPAAGRLGVTGSAGEVSISNRSTPFVASPGAGERYSLYADNASAGNGTLRIWSGSDLVTLDKAGDMTMTGALTTNLGPQTITVPFWDPAVGGVATTGYLSVGSGATPTALCFAGQSQSYGCSTMQDFTHFMDFTFTQVRVMVQWVQTGGSNTGGTTLALEMWSYYYPSGGTWTHTGDFNSATSGRGTDGSRGPRFDWTAWMPVASFASADVGALGLRVKGGTGQIYRVTLYFR